MQRMGGKTRFGRGFSQGELANAGIHIKEALKLGIPVDIRRKTTHKENIEALKRFMAEVKETAKAS